MGSDIHLCFEKKTEKREWQPIVIPDYLIPDDRDYSVFYFLAAVRRAEATMCEPQFENRGIPDDSSIRRVLNLTKHNNLRYSGSLSGADHSFTHAYLDEILRAPWEKVGLQHRWFYVFCDRVLPRLIGNYGTWGALEKRKVRVIMGFDS